MQLTRRPNSFVPAHTLERLLRLPQKPDEERLGLNWTMHWGQGILLGAVRGLMAERGMRGPVGSSTTRGVDGRRAGLKLPTNLNPRFTDGLML